MKKSVFIVLVCLCFGFVANQASANLSKKELQQKVLETEVRLKRLESISSAQVVLELMERVEQLQSDNATLLGRIEEQANEIGRLKKRQRDLYLDIDRRLTEAQTPIQPQAEEIVAPVETAQPVQPIQKNTATNTKPNDVPTVKPIDPAQERKDYEAAFNLLIEGRHNDAISAFNNHISNYANGKFSHNAQYWIGEAHYVTRRFDKAASAFTTVIDKYPNSNKDADARLKLGYTYYELKQWDNARKTLAEIVQRYPTSKAASLAEKRLLEMTQQKR